MGTDDTRGTRAVRRNMRILGVMLLAVLAGASACQRMKKQQHVEPEPTGSREISQPVTGGAANQTTTAWTQPLCWVAKDLETDEQVEIKSAAKLKYEMVRDADGTLRRV